ncbi:MAG: glycosyltransferase family 2 protein [Candidatus Alcyoniella australis]|nr:glycosyltransferase family 2 protein [Candidatus Alcyoniella australis]
MADISAVFPIYNEVQLLPALVAQARAALEACGCAARLVLVDDGSDDGSTELIRELALADPLITAVHHPHNRGYGAALISGLSAADSELIMFSDADLQFDLAQIGTLLAAQQSAGVDVVVGYRSPRADPWHRLLYGRVWTAMVNVLLRVRVRDVNCAFKLMTRQARDALRLDQLQIQGPGINAAIFLRWKQAGLDWVEVPIAHRPRPSGLQTGGSAGAIRRGFRELMLLRKISRNG